MDQRRLDHDRHRIREPVMRIALIILMMLAAVGTAHAFLLIGKVGSTTTSCAFHLTGNAHLTGNSNLRCGP